MPCDRRLDEEIQFCVFYTVKSAHVRHCRHCISLYVYKHYVSYNKDHTEVLFSLVVIFSILLRTQNLCILCECQLCRLSR